MSQVYFIKAGSRTKIGYTSNLSKRLPALQTGSSEALELIVAIPGGARLEAAFHAVFSSYRRVGEWFDGSLLGLVIDLLKAGAQPKTESDIRALCTYAIHESRLDGALKTISESEDHEDLRQAHILVRRIRRARALHSFEK